MEFLGSLTRLDLALGVRHGVSADPRRLTFIWAFKVWGVDRGSFGLQGLSGLTYI